MIFPSPAAPSKTIRWNFNDSIVDLARWIVLSERDAKKSAVSPPLLPSRPEVAIHLMNPTSLARIAEYAVGNLSGGDGSILVDKISTDSRTLKPGELFVALRGENFDGHEFVQAAAKAGAAGAIVESNWRGKVPETFALVRSEVTFQAYQQLACIQRITDEDKV